MLKIESDQNSVTPKGTKFAKERFAELIKAISDVQIKRGIKDTAQHTARKLGIMKRLIKD